MLPEFGLGVKPSLVSSASSSTTSPSISDAGVRSPPDYVYSPNPSKRRRVSVGEEDDERASPRRQRYTPPWTETPNQAPRQLSVDTVPRSATDSWTGPSPVSSQNGSLPPIWSAVAMDAAEANERAHAQTSVSSPTRRPLTDTYPRERSRGFTFPDYSQRAGMEHTSAPPAPYQPGGYYLSHRAPSLSVPPAHYGRSGYDSAHHYRRNSYDTVQHYPDYMHMSEHAEMGSNGLNKPPKKRGNLPKDTTDKLLAWFHAHLDHPYPTEEEKHKLMRQTGLQMSKFGHPYLALHPLPREQYQLTFH